ncbi:MAG: hypothetical protein HY821_15240 [Acidobacteria bacterium]|nr:hypothetical protein [Acidobacteriota bacterium]
MPQQLGDAIGPTSAAAQAEASVPFRTLETASGARAELSARVLDAIRFESSRAMNGVGGLGIGGVLLGTRSGNAFRVFAWRPLICDHSRGPAFLLSARDWAGMASYLEGVRLQAAAKEWDVVGWFVSHPKGGLALSGEEQELQRRHFPPQGLILVVNPDQVGDAVCAVCAGGEKQPGEPVLVQPLPIRKREPGEKRPKASAEAWSGPLFEEDAPPSRGMPGRPRVWVSVAVLVLTCAGAGIWWQLRDHPAKVVPFLDAPPIEMLSLHAGPRGGRFVIEWNGQAQAIRYASKVSLRIQDGGETSTVELSRRDAAAGLQFYPVKSGHVRVTLVLASSGGQSFEESAEYYEGGQPSQPISDIEGSVISPATATPAPAPSQPVRGTEPAAKKSKKKRTKRAKKQSADQSSSPK